MGLILDLLFSFVYYQPKIVSFRTLESIFEYILFVFKNINLNKTTLKSHKHYAETKFFFVLSKTRYLNLKATSNKVKKQSGKIFLLS